MEDKQGPVWQPIPGIEHDPVEDLERFAECCRHPFWEGDELWVRLASDDKDDKIWCAVYFWFKRHELTGGETLREIVASVINDYSLLDLSDAEGKFLWKCVSDRFEAFKAELWGTVAE